MCKADRLLAAAPERSNRGFSREIALGQRARPENPLLCKNHGGTLGLHSQDDGLQRKPGVSKFVSQPSR